MKEFMNEAKAYAVFIGTVLAISALLLLVVPWLIKFGRWYGDWVTNL